MSGRFSIPRGETVSLPQFGADDELNQPMVPVPDTYPYLREKRTGHIHPYNEAMAQRSDLVEGYDPGTEKSQLAQMDQFARPDPNAQLEAINRLGQNAHRLNPFATRS